MSKRPESEKDVQLIAPNGVRVRVSESKSEARLAVGYTQVPVKRAATKRSKK